MHHFMKKNKKKIKNERLSNHLKQLKQMHFMD